MLEFKALKAEVFHFFLTNKMRLVRIAEILKRGTKQYCAEALQKA